MEFKVYKIYDKRLGNYLKAQSGKEVWHTAAAAKNATLTYLRYKDLEISEMTPEYYENNCGKQYRDRPKFKDQTRFECHEFTLGEEYDIIK